MSNIFMNKFIKKHYGFATASHRPNSSLLSSRDRSAPSPNNVRISLQYWAVPCRRATLIWIYLSTQDSDVGAGMDCNGLLLLDHELIVMGSQDASGYQVS